MNIVIGLAGEKGAGKETLARCIEEVVRPHSFAHVRFTDLLKETLALWNLPPTRVNLQKIAVVMDEGFGVGTLAAALAERLKKIEAEVVVLESIRWDSDAALVRSFPQNLLLYITADAKTRYERTKQRGEKAGESEATFEQFLEEEKAPNEIHIARIGASADTRFENVGSIDELRGRVQELYESRIKPLL